MQGRLYIVGENEELKEMCDVQQADISGIEVENQKEGAPRRIEVPVTEFSVDVDMVILRLTVLSLLYGFKVTNNWLKMHGGIMTRKRKGRKRKK